jgi:hypothetical protein
MSARSADGAGRRSEHPVIIEREILREVLTINGVRYDVHRVRHAVSNLETVA